MADDKEFCAFIACWSPGGVRFAVGTTDMVAHVYHVGPPIAVTSSAVASAAGSAASSASASHGATVSGGSAGGSAGGGGKAAASGGKARVTASTALVTTGGVAVGAGLAKPAGDPVVGSVPEREGGKGRRRPCWVATLRGHKNDVSSVAWACDGRRLATGSKDGTARLWRFKELVVGGRTLNASEGQQAERWGCTLLGTMPQWGEEIPVVTVRRLETTTPPSSS